MNILKKIENLGNIFGKKNNSFLGVDVGSSSIKIVQLKKKKGVVVLETYGELSLGPYAKIEAGRATNLSSANLSDALSSLIKESNVTTKECGVSIPLRSSLVFTMEMPPMDEKQLNQMVPIEARKYVPVSISEVDLDWRIIPKEEAPVSSFMGEDVKKEVRQEKIEILAVAIHKDTVEKQKEIINGAGLNLNFLEIEIFSTIRTITGQNMLSFAVLDMGAGSTKLFIVEKGIVRDSHMIGRGSQDITLNIARSTGISVSDAEQQKVKIGVNGKTDFEKEISNVVYSNMEFIFGEVNKTILSYQKKYNKNISKMIITGGGSIVNGMIDFAKSHSEMEIEISDPFSNIDTPAFLDDLLKKVGPGFAVAIGVALKGLRGIE